MSFGDPIAGTAIVMDLEMRGAAIVISRHSCRTKPRDIGAEMHRWRHPIENFCRRPKEFGRIAPRADKTDRRFAAMIDPAATLIAAR